MLQSLQDYETGHLRIIAELWGLELPSAPSLELTHALAQQMLDPEAAAEIVDSLPLPARQALDLLMRHGGRFLLADLVRRFGALRMMGAGRRDREKPWRSDPSPLEALWYRGLIAFAFSDTKNGPLEFAFIPADLRPMLPQPPPLDQAALGTLAKQPKVIWPASTAAPDDCATLLAALRRRPNPEATLSQMRLQGLAPFLFQAQSHALLLALLQEMGIVTGPPLQPAPKATRALLDLTHVAIGKRLLQAWARSPGWNDLAHVPSLLSGADTWPNDPLASRTSVLQILQSLPLGEWWDLAGFLAQLRQQRSTFLRPAGDFDSWYLRSADTGAFLQGFENWNEVEGALLRFIITAPLHWLGAADLGAASDALPAIAFRLTPLAAALFDIKGDSEATEAPLPTVVRPDGRITVPRQAALDIRYQIARFSMWEQLDDKGYHFRLTPSSLRGAIDQGLRFEHIIKLMQASSEREIPEALKRALANWSARGPEARLDRLVVLRLQDPQTLTALRKNRATARYLGEILGTQSVVVWEQDWMPLMSAAVRLGILIDPPGHPGEQP